ncbi:MAG: PadR family transcriptional regulator [Oscillospiraceae bacterium]|nr:PadR family transcriptional regulator [Oscillospiraceae bacterium]MBR2781951.1 PadR family transcriptional regulator [Oscillospiraceae bacterium]
MDPQMKRGVLEICILSALSRGDSYGYQLIRDLEDYVSVSESTLYPILRRLEASGSLEVYSVEHNFRLRKMYRLTPAGAQQIEAFLESWPELQKMYDYIREGSANA